MDHLLENLGDERFQELCHALLTREFQNVQCFPVGQPDAQPTPPVPEGVTAVLVGTNAISIKWPPTTRAEHYRIWAKVIGVDVDLGHVGTSSDLDFLLEQLPSNTDVEVALSAVNSGGESAKTAPITVRTL